MNIPVEVQIVLGSAEMPVSDLMAPQKGSTVSLNRRIGEPVDVAWNFLPMAAVCDALVAAGLAVELRLDRAPYPT